MPGKVTFVILGQNHTDAVTPQNTLEAVQRLHASSIPLKLAVENEHNTTLQDMIRLNVQQVAEAEVILEGSLNKTQTIQERVIAKAGKMGVVLHDPKPYFFTAEEFGEKEFDERAGLKGWAERGAAYRTEVETLRLAEKYGIPLQGLDLTGGERDDLLTQTRAAKEAADNVGKLIGPRVPEGMEFARIDMMSTQALKMMQSMGEKGGVILALNVGNMHVASLQTMLEEKLKKQGITHGEVVGIAASPQVALAESNLKKGVLEINADTTTTETVKQQKIHVLEQALEHEKHGIHAVMRESTTHIRDYADTYESIKYPGYESNDMTQFATRTDANHGRVLVMANSDVQQKLLNVGKQHPGPVMTTREALLNTKTPEQPVKQMTTVVNTATAPPPQQSNTAGPTVPLASGGTVSQKDHKGPDTGPTAKTLSTRETLEAAAAKSGKKLTPTGQGLGGNSNTPPQSTVVKLG